MESILFQLFCVVLMWPMIFSVPILFGNASSTGKISETLITATSGIFTAFISWILFGYYLTFSSFDFTIIEYFTEIQQGNPELIMTVFLQGSFLLYSAVMFIGTLLEKVKAQFFISFIPFWILLVYVPVAYLLWNPSSFLVELGALDFSGGLVVHVTAGFTSLVLARIFKNTLSYTNERDKDRMPTYTAVILICFGWFGFNLGPLETFTPDVSRIALNTALAIICGSSGFLLADHKNSTSNDALDGMVVGLVTSTALVGYASPLAVAITCSLSGFTTRKINNQFDFNDPIDSFVLNGLGAIFGVIGLILFANPAFTPNEQSGLIHGFQSFNFILIELAALLLTILITIGGSYASFYISQKVLKLKDHF